jgi:hypothetical protein
MATLFRAQIRDIIAQRGHVAALSKKSDQDDDDDHPPQLELDSDSDLDSDDEGVSNTHHTPTPPLTDVRKPQVRTRDEDEECLVS